jgi:hypothetical protein
VPRWAIHDTVLGLASQTFGSMCAKSEPKKGGSKDRVLFLAENAALQIQNDYAMVRVRLPDGAVSPLKSLKPGEWVTVTSRHRSFGDATPSSRSTRT